MTLLYRELVMEVRKQIINTGLTMAQCDELSGNECGYTAKSLSPDSRSGRQSTYRMLQNLLDVIFIGGFTVRIKPHADREVIRAVLSKKLAARGDMLNGLSLPERVRKRGMQGKTPIADFAVEAGRRGGARRREMPERKRIALARQAAKARWCKPRVVEVDPQTLQPLTPATK